ncbi:hypothetical protein QFC21_004834 [Naganishia friedmannii]|uniref:Uncharacterized protein n=1 Tax=Naganishia friedmannii TaxID=89922 RepID=A0ACC2VCQ0_9TREE|nr:hypothetical protein QFC21_004834 [Naganishia friedmannii]
MPNDRGQHSRPQSAGLPAHESSRRNRPFEGGAAPSLSSSPSSFSPEMILDPHIFQIMQEIASMDEGTSTEHRNSRVNQMFLRYCREMDIPSSRAIASDSYRTIMDREGVSPEGLLARLHAFAENAAPYPQAAKNAVEHMVRQATVLKQVLREPSGAKGTLPDEEVNSAGAPLTLAVSQTTQSIPPPISSSSANCDQSLKSSSSQSEEEGGAFNTNRFAPEGGNERHSARRQLSISVESAQQVDSALFDETVKSMQTKIREIIRVWDLGEAIGDTESRPEKLLRNECTEFVHRIRPVSDTTEPYMQKPLEQFLTSVVINVRELFRTRFLVWERAWACIEEALEKIRNPTTGFRDASVDSNTLIQEFLLREWASIDVGRRAVPWNRSLAEDTTGRNASSTDVTTTAPLEGTCVTAQETKLTDPWPQRFTLGSSNRPSQCGH